MSPQAAEKRLRKLLREPGPHSLIWYHELGRVMTERFPDGRPYGEYGALMEAVLDDFNSQSSARESKVGHLRSVLDAAALFYTAYSRDEARGFEKPPPGTHPLNWNHLLLLVRLPTADRLRMQTLAIEQKWVSTRLHQELQIRFGRKNKGGRRTQKSAGPRQALLRLIKQTETLLARIETDWRGADAVAAKAKLADRGTAVLTAEAVEVLAELKRRIADVQRLLPGSPSNTGSRPEPKSQRKTTRRRS